MFDDAAFNRTLFFPRPGRSEPPAGADDTFVDVDGAALHLRIHRAPAATRTVLFFHGNGEVVADYDETARSYANMGASLAVVDYRGYGMSSGQPTLRAITEDAHGVLAAALARTEGPVVVMGRSLGSACANELYGTAHLGPRVTGFVLESGFTNLPRLAERRQMTAPARADPIFDPRPKLARGVLPLLVLHGARDTLIRPDEADAAFAAAGTEAKELVMIEGRGHNDISSSPAYWQALASFMGRL